MAEVKSVISEWTPEQWEALGKYCEEHKQEIEEFFARSQLEHDESYLYYHGYLTVKYMPCFEGVEEGNHYVYIWKHNGGSPFYVGSGVRYRAGNVGDRREEFHKELSKGDCVLWYVVEGISEKAARRIEHFCSVWLSSRGYRLCNRDFNISYMTARRLHEHYEELNAEWFAPEMADRLEKILGATEVERERARKIAEKFKSNGGKFFFQEGCRA